MFLVNFSSLLLFFIFCVVLSGIIFLLSFLFSAKADDAEKLTAYECGFNPFDDSRAEFDIRFYIVAILFLVFDLEISFLFPFSVSLSNNDASTTVWVMLCFLIILTVGFVFE